MLPAHAKQIKAQHLLCEVDYLIKRLKKFKPFISYILLCFVVYLFHNNSPL
jgi:hypothetical protein